MNIKQSASALVILAAVALVGAGCLSSSKGETQEATTTFATGPNGSMVTTVSGETTTVRDATLGLSFSFPTSLGEIRTQDENGFGTEGTKSGDGSPADCLVQRSFLAGDTIFLTSYDTWQCEQLDRGGYWGDQARAFETEEDVKKWCETKDVCEPYVNPNGITIYRAWSKSVDAWGDTLSNIDEYGIWNPDRTIHGILLSNQGFVQAGLGRQQDALIAIVDSLSFYME